MEPVKWPKTSYLPWTGAADFQDKKLDKAAWEKGDYVVTEKLDGECTTMTREFVHARSTDSNNHASRTKVKQLWGMIGHMIPEDLYLVGENTSAVHSIVYPEMDGFFYLFAVHDGINILSWDETELVARFLMIPTVPVITRFRGDMRWSITKDDWSKKSKFGPETEGYVIRRDGRIPMRDWPEQAAKYVRPHHVQTDEHWMYRPMVPQGSTHE